MWFGPLAILCSLAATAISPRASAQQLTGVQASDPAQPPPSASDGPVIEFDAPVYKFGRVLAGQPVRHDFRFANIGHQLLVIADVEPSCGCATAGPYDKEVPPNQAGKIPIAMNTTTLAGKIHKSVVVTSNAPARSTLRLHLVGEVAPLVEVTPPSAFFGTFKEDVRQQRVLRIVNNVDKPLEITDIKHDRARFETKLKTLKPGTEFELTVTALPPFESGYMHGAIVLRTNLREMPLVTISAKGYRSPAVMVTPRIVSLPLPMAAAVERRIFIHPTDRPLLKLTDLKVTNDELKVALTKTEAGGNPGYWIVVTAPAGYKLPDKEVRITFRTDDPSTPEVTVPVYQRRLQAKRPPAFGSRTNAAGSFLRIAKTLLHKGDEKNADNLLRRVVDRYPESDAAKDAKRLLDEMRR